VTGPDDDDDVRDVLPVTIISSDGVTPGVLRSDDSIRVEDAEARKRRRVSCQIETNLAVIAVMTEAQRDALDTLFRDSDVTRVRVTLSFDLPTDWLYWIAVEGGALAGWHGGISPEGHVHT
jgi:hypothetical protein